MGLALTIFYFYFFIIFLLLPLKVLASCKKIEFEIIPDTGCENIETLRKVVMENLFLCVRRSVILSCCSFFSVLSGHKDKSVETLL